MLHIKNHCSKTSGKFSRNVLATAITVALGGVAANVGAVKLPDGAQLSFATGAARVVGCGYGTINPTTGTCTSSGTPTGTELTDVGGSYFGMDTNGDGIFQPGDKTILSMFSPVVLGAAPQKSLGAHPGAPTGGEQPTIDDPWFFAGNTGMSQFGTSPTTITDLGASQTLDFSGWQVVWSGFNETNTAGTGAGFTFIPMGDVASLQCFPQGSIGLPSEPLPSPPPVAKPCASGDDYIAIMDAHVPNAFTSTDYQLHLEGTVTLPGNPPTSSDVPTVNTLVDNPVTINMLPFVGSTADFIVDSLTAVTGPGNGGAVGTNTAATTAGAGGAASFAYTPNSAYSGPDSFNYTIANASGASPVSTVSLDVQVNQPPAAVDDTLEVQTAVLDATPQIARVLDNDTDINNARGLIGGIAPATLTVVSQPATGSCTADTDPASLDFGTIAYAQTAPSVAGTFTCTYRVSDSDPVNGALTSNPASLVVTVTNTSSDWPVALPSDIIPVLYIQPGEPGDPADPGNQLKPITVGSFFTMEVELGKLIYTPMLPGPDRGVVIGWDQPSTGSHPGAPNGTEEPAVDMPWNFFGNTGFMWTKNGGVVGNPDGTLKFGGEQTGPNTYTQGRWMVNWNGNEEIDLGGDPANFPEDLGFATITCTPAPCQDQSTFELEYAAHVPAGDPSGFDEVPFTIHFEGTVGFLDGNLKASSGTVSQFMRMNASDVGVADSEVRLQCAAGCFDYTVNGVSGKELIVLPLAGGVPTNPVWRILDNGTWRSFDTGAGDTIKSAPFTPGDVECPNPGDAAYGDLTEGHQCIELGISDNGPNDLDPATGTISDPSGMGSGNPDDAFQDARTSNTSGCSLVVNNNASAAGRSDWWVLAGFLAWIGWSRGKKHVKH